MNKLVSITLFSLFLSSCSLINTDSRDHYAKRSESLDMGHGLKMIDEGKESSSLLLTMDKQAVKRGKAIYENHCMKCHGQDGQGNGTAAKNLKHQPLNLVKAVAKNPGFRFFISISRDAKIMPGWSEKNFSEKELTDLTHYLRSLAMK